MTSCDSDPNTELGDCGERFDDTFYDNPIIDGGNAVIEEAKKADDKAGEILDSLGNFFAGGGDGNVETAAPVVADPTYGRKEREDRGRAAGLALIARDWTGIEATITDRQVSDTKREVTLSFPYGADGSTLQFTGTFEWDAVNERYALTLGTDFQLVSADGTYMDMVWPQDVWHLDRNTNATSGGVQPGTPEAYYVQTGELMLSVIANELLEEYGITEGNLQITTSHWMPELPITNGVVGPR